MKEAEPKYKLHDTATAKVQVEHLKSGKRFWQEVTGTIYSIEVTPTDVEGSKITYGYLYGICEPRSVCIYEGGKVASMVDYGKFSEEAIVAVEPSLIWGENFNGVEVIDQNIQHG